MEGPRGGRPPDDFSKIPVCGLPEVVLQRGRVLVENGEFHGRPGWGTFIRRSRLSL